jgi:hypothetical protein
VISVHGVRHESSSRCAGGFGSGLFIHEEAQMRGLIADPDSRLPLPLALMPRHTTVRRRCACIARNVLLVSALQQRSKVGSTAVQLVAINVVTFNTVALGKTKQFSMQIEGLAPTGPLTTRSVPISKRPAPLVDPLGVSGIDDGMRSDRSIAGTERDQNGILIVHRITPGAAPLAVSSGFGAPLRCLKYTRSLRVSRPIGTSNGLRRAFGEHVTGGRVES